MVHFVDERVSPPGSLDADLLGGGWLPRVHALTPRPPWTVPTGATWDVAVVDVASERAVADVIRATEASGVTAPRIARFATGPTAQCAAEAFDAGADEVTAADGGAAALAVSLLRVARVTSREARARGILDALHGRESDARRLAEECRALAVAAEATHRAKDQLLAVVSHELRAPLHAIVGRAELLRAGAFEGDERNHALDVIIRNARLQTRLVDDLLDASHAAAGTLQIDPREANLVSLLRAALDAVRPAAEAGSVRVVTGPLPRSLRVRVDADRIARVFERILENAVKFTPPHGVVTVHLDDLDDRARITVGDTGCGIAPGFLDRIFQPFVIEDGASTRRYGGLGLGLAISATVVGLHRGTLSAHSDGPGRGTTVVCELPRLEERTSVPSAAPSTGELTGVDALVIDDDPDSRELFEAGLSMYGVRVRTADSLASALDALRERPVEVVLSDLGMPGQDGFAVAQALRALRVATGLPRIVLAVTGFTGHATRVRALEAGFDDHVTKPVQIHELTELLARHLRAHPEPPSAVEAKTP